MVLLVDKRTRVVFYMFTVGNKQAKIEELSNQIKERNSKPVRLTVNAPAMPITEALHCFCSLP